VVATSGAQALELARTLNPDGITLDLRLPDMDGWVVLDQLKHDPRTRHIPVHVISALDDERRGLEQGAIAFLQKTADLEALGAAIGRPADVPGTEGETAAGGRGRRRPAQGHRGADRQRRRHHHAVASAEEALATLDSEPFDCVVLDLKLPGMSGFDLITTIKERPNSSRIPIIVYTGKELSRSEETKLRKIAETIIVKDVRSPERLLDETALFLHRVESKLPGPKREMLRRVAETDPSLAGKKVLLVDDDARNLFALTTVLEQHAMKVVYGENGQQALDKLKGETDVDVVLMDIMMPEMDGYEATRRIRAQTKYANLPVIALTAKAMKGDREKCIQAGASDYITKPVDPDQLVSLLRCGSTGKTPDGRARASRGRGPRSRSAAGSPGPVLGLRLPALRPSLRWSAASAR
jgi:CheY-like chemotaxis protein